MNLIDGLFSDRGLQALERAVRFTEARHQRLLENIANAETPGYRRKDLSPERFNAALKEAIQASKGGALEPARWPPEDFAESDPPRRMLRILREADDSPPEGVLRHDGNDVDIDREMAALARNASRFNQAINLLKKCYGEIQMAISERVTG
ncbi:MAG: flagellar basal body rod protein FlgB [Planctomycetes bacterium]|nr:flagellar basal body rod protein FlgB [Planctomycetota bacterium]